MTDAFIPENQDEIPEVGQHISLPIIQAPTRTTLFPDIMTVALPANGLVEIVLLRTEYLMFSQEAEVAEVNGGVVNLKTLGSKMGPQLWDIGHLRVSQDSALTMAVGLLEHLVLQGRENADELLARLQAALKPPTSSV